MDGTKTRNGGRRLRRRQLRWLRQTVDVVAVDEKAIGSIFFEKNRKICFLPINFE